MDIIEYQNNIRNFIDYPVEVGPYSVILSLSENIGILSDKLNKVLKSRDSSSVYEKMIKWY